MRALGWLAFLWLVALTPDVLLAKTLGANALFNEAVALDVSGGGDASRAFDLYRKAAELGLPAAQFNVGVMLDSGRGTSQNLPQAATWYARAAAHGNQRAAYNMGQLYEAGQGVPRNVDVARAWFTASNLPAARSRLAALRSRAEKTAPLKAPTCVSPAAGARSSEAKGVELVWLAVQQDEPVRFFVEVRSTGPSGSAEVFSGFTETTSVFVPLPEGRGDYVWRVLAVGRRAGNYMATDWSRFTIVPE